MRILSLLFTVVGMISAYRIAVVNDIHADLNYDPSSATCISKTLKPAELMSTAAGEEKPETYKALRAQSVALLG
jgi:hypothetical protein